MLRRMVRATAEPLVRAFCNSADARRGLLWAAYRASLVEFQARHARVETVPGATYQDRRAFYARLFDMAKLTEPIDYLEFGVYKGASIKWWSEANQAPRSRFFGFDSFEGLPESANAAWQKGRFSVDKAVPQVNDPRVSFQAGWFNHTVPPFMRTFERRNRMLVNLDADIYSSTALALAHMGPFLRAGDVLIFDEFADTVNEWRAFCDFNAIFGLPSRPILQQRGWMTVAFEIG